MLVRLGGTEVQDSAPTEASIVGPSTAQWDLPAVVYSEDSFFLNLGSMMVGRLYPVRLGGVEMVAVKDDDGSVSFYARP